MKQQLNSNSKKISRPLLDVLIRWSSTVIMLRRFLCLRTHIDTATANLFRDKVKLGLLQQCIRFTSAEVTQIENVIKMLYFAEQGTKILDVSEYPSTHLHDVVLRNNLEHCNEV